MTPLDLPRLGRTAAALAAFVPAALAACGPAPLPPPSSPAPVATARPSAPPAVVGLVAGAPDEASVDMTLVASLPAFGGRFERVELPPKTPVLLSLDGRDDRDVWMLAADGRVLRWDGKSVTSAGTPECYTDSCCGTLFDCKRKPSLCTRAAAEHCQPFGGPCAMLVDWASVRVAGDDVVVSTIVETGGLRGSLVEARRRRDGRWSCEQGKDDFVYPGMRARGDTAHAYEVTLDGATIRFEGPAFLVNPNGGNLLVVDGRRVPLPQEASWTRSGVALAARSPGDLWLWQDDPARVWRGNGLAWYPFPVGLETVADLWLTEPGTAWVLGADGEAGTESLVRWDIDKKSGQRFATPGAVQVLKGRGDEIWLLGEKAVYPWDGRELRRADAPLAVQHAWRSDAGTVWLIGGDLDAKVKLHEADVPAGAVFRVRSEGGQKP